MANRGGRVEILGARQREGEQQNVDLRNVRMRLQQHAAVPIHEADNYEEQNIPPNVSSYKINEFTVCTKAAIRMINDMIAFGDTRYFTLRYVRTVLLVLIYHIGYIIFFALSYYYRESIDCLTKSKEKKGKKNGSRILAEKQLHKNLIEIGPALYNLARHFIVKKAITHPRLTLNELMTAFKGLICQTKKFISPTWCDQFFGKVWDLLQRFHYARIVDRLTFFYDALRSNPENLTCGALEGFSIFHSVQPIFGRIASIGNPEERQVSFSLFIPPPSRHHFANFACTFSFFLFLKGFTRILFASWHKH